MQFVAVKAKELRYAVELSPSGELREENGVVLDTPAEWSPEHLLLAALIRCSLKSLRYHAPGGGRRGSLGLRQRADTRDETGDGRAVRRRRGHGRARRRARAVPVPGPLELSELLELAERDCFIGSSLTAEPQYRWTVNGRTIGS